MKQSQRAKRMAKHRMRLNFVPKLNLVPLIDCFTLLIFFLLINYSAEVEILHTDKSVKLPVSVSDTAPGETLVIMVNGNDIVVQGRRVGSMQELIAENSGKFAPLETELKYLASKAAPLAEADKAAGRPITILGDKAIPYEQLKKIMASCVAADYRNIALAVTHIEASNKTSGGG
ncbi:MAG TPA: biopolymer transporter ExbD [Cellvibrio sp.]|nr:biopolymer transporter ExbD [Cellvibrio sp.]